MHPKDLHIKDFSYDLPEERIAKYPLAQRDESKLLVYRHGNIAEDCYKNIATYLPEHTMLVFNNTKVIQARLHFENSTGARIEIFCLEPAEENPEMAKVMSQTGSVRWKCLVGRLAKWKEEFLTLKADGFELQAKIISRENDTFTIAFSWQPSDLSFAEILDKTGQLPIPPYLKRSTETIDHERYQTVYAEHQGSVAAPTAGLHFTPTIFAALSEKQIAQTYVTLHVGAGTFKPVKSETIADHEMHAEWIGLSRDTIQSIVGRPSLVAVGTTSLRTLETLYWMGVKAKQNPTVTLQELELKQWDAYDHKWNAYETKRDEALTALLDWMSRHNSTPLICKTQILIAPPYQLKMADALITNFHQPNSTLLLLVAAVVGEDWKTIYDYALANDFRFLSYGDGSLLFAR